MVSTIALILRAASAGFKPRAGTSSRLETGSPNPFERVSRPSRWINPSDSSGSANHREVQNGGSPSTLYREAVSLTDLLEFNSPTLSGGSSSHFQSPSTHAFI